MFMHHRRQHALTQQHCTTQLSRALPLVIVAAALVVFSACDSDDDAVDMMSTSDAAQADQTSTPDATGTCPPLEPIPGGACEAVGACEYGEECCGENCGASYVCECNGSIATSCINTDFALGCAADMTQSDGSGGMCRTEADCSAAESCVPPNANLCGACNQGNLCSVDGDCAAGEVCSDRMTVCPCAIELVCATACSSAADCRTGDVCNGGHCEPQTCAADGDCTTTNFTCDLAESVCKRATCAADGDCASGVCVDGRCHDTMGSCTLPVP